MPIATFLKNLNYCSWKCITKLTTGHYPFLL